MGANTHILLSADLNFPSRLHHHLALTSAGRGDGEGGREDPPVEPEPNPFTDLTPTDSAEDPLLEDRPDYAINPQRRSAHRRGQRAPATFLSEVETSSQPQQHSAFAS
jgi:hypothetical protein